MTDDTGITGEGDEPEDVPPNVVVVGEADFTDEAPVQATVRSAAPLPGAAAIGAELGGVIPRHRESTRRWLAGGLVGLFATVTVLSLAAVITGWQDVDVVKSVLEVLVPPIVALTGSALGFFFGVERGAG